VQHNCAVVLHGAIYVFLILVMYPDKCGSTEREVVLLPATSLEIHLKFCNLSSSLTLLWMYLHVLLTP